MSRSPELGAEHTVRLTGGTVRYRESGTGPSLLFVHGVLVNGDLWRKVVPGLARSYRCIVPDLPIGAHRDPLDPGADRSPVGIARLIGEMIDALELDDVTIVANDSGGALTQILVAERPEVAARLVLTPCDAFDNFLPPLFKPLQLTAYLPGGIMLLAQTLRIPGAARLPIALGWLTNEPVDAETMQSWIEPPLSSPGVRADVAEFLRRITSRDTVRAAAELGEFRGPVLIAWSDDDRVFPLRHAERLAELFPDARLEVIPDSRAFVPEDQPAALAELIARFCEQTAASAA